jgi:hypothetical protein
LGFGALGPGSSAKVYTAWAEGLFLLRSLSSSPLPISLCSCPDRQPKGAEGPATFKTQAVSRCLACQSPHFPCPGTPGLRAQHCQTGLLQGEVPAHPAPTPGKVLQAHTVPLCMLGKAPHQKKRKCTSCVCVLGREQGFLQQPLPGLMCRIDKPTHGPNSGPLCTPGSNI